MAEEKFELQKTQSETHEEVITSSEVLATPLPPKNVEDENDEKEMKDLVELITANQKKSERKMRTVKTKLDKKDVKKAGENSDGPDAALINLVNTPILQLPKIFGKKEKDKSTVQQTPKTTKNNTPLTPEGANKSPARKQGEALVEILSDAVGRVDQNIDNQPYYHGFMGRDECEAMIQDTGDFLVRQTEIGKHVSYVISLRWAKDNHHFLVRKTRTKKLYWVKDYAFKSICELIAYHKMNRYPIHQNMILFCGIGRQTWQLNHEQVVLKNKLGEGQFGEVYQGYLRTSIFKAPFIVAVKTLIQDHLTANEKILFLREANVMLSLAHPNVIKFHGVCTMKNPIMIVMEFCEGKSLEDCLRAKSVDDELKLIYLYHAICGIDYLHGKHVLHRDIAARNCLLTSDHVLKISDFGLSVKGVAIKERKGGRLPVKYMAPETLKKGLYSSSSDIYSYGALIYEVYHEGGIPFADSPLSGNVLRKAIINQQITLELTGKSPPFVQTIFERSRKYEPEERIKAEEIKDIFKKESDVKYVSKGLRQQFDEFSDSLKKRAKLFYKRKNKNQLDVVEKGEHNLTAVS